MRKSLVAGNWKMHGTRDSVANLLHTLSGAFSGSHAASSSPDVVVFPPSIFIDQARQALASSLVAVGAQNMSCHSHGAFTGEISAEMLVSVGATHVIVGHSERRSLFGETDEDVAAKTSAAISAGLVPIVCVGETLQERKLGATLDVVERQVRAAFGQSISIGADAVLVAYEPVWAIGTGLTAAPGQAQEVHAFIRKILGDMFGDVSAQMRLLYGGSVKGGNARELFACPDIDGGLIGGASLVAEEFLAICQSVKEF